MWRPTEIGEVIAERQLKLRGRKPGKVTLVIGRPVHSVDKNDPWWCPTELRGALQSFVPIAGEDSLQSLVLALQFHQHTLPSLARRNGGEIAWLNERERLVFAETHSIMLQWNAIKNLLDGLVAATTELESPGKPPATLLKRLRKLIASHGAR
jgi:hypothetical protein